MTMKVMKHLESKKNSNPYTHTYIDFFFLFFFLVKFFFGVWRSTSLFLSLLMFDWRTVSSSVLWLLDRRYLSLSLLCLSTSLLCTFFLLFFFISRFFFYLCLSLIQLWLCMFLFFVYVCRILKRENFCLSVLLTNNNDTRKNCVNKKNKLIFFHSWN